MFNSQSGGTRVGYCLFCPVALLDEWFGRTKWMLETGENSGILSCNLGILTQSLKNFRSTVKEVREFVSIVVK